MNQHNFGIPSNDNSNNGDQTVYFLKRSLDEKKAEADNVRKCMEQLQQRIDTFSRERKEHLELVSKIKHELQALEGKVADGERRLDKESRLRFEAQDSLAAAEEAVKETREQNKILENELKITSGNLQRLENVNIDFQNIACEAVKSSNALKDKINELGEKSKNYMAELKKLQTDKKVANQENNSVKKEFFALSKKFASSKCEIEVLKKGSMLQEQYLRGTQERLKDISEKFNGMKELFTNRSKTADQQYEELLVKYEVEKENSGKLTHEIKALHESDQKRSQRMIELETKLNHHAENLVVMREIKKELETKLAQAESNMENLRTENTRLVNDVHTARTVIQQERVATIEANALNHSHDASQHQIKYQHETMLVRCQSLESEVKESKDKYHHVKEQNIVLQSEERNLKDSLMKLQNDHNLLEANRKSVAQSLEGKMIEVKQLVERCQVAEAEYCIKGELCEELKRKLDKADTDIELHLQKGGQLEQQLRDSQQARQTGLKKIQDMDNKFTKCQQIFQTNEDQIQVFMKQKKILEIDVKSRDEIIQAHEEKAKTLEQMIEEAKCQEIRSQNELQDAKDAVNKIIEEKEELRVRLTEAAKKVTEEMDKDIEEQRKQLSFKEAESQMLQERINENEMKISKGKDILRRRDEEISMLKQRVDECSAKIDSLTSHVDKQQEKIANLKAAARSSAEKILSLEKETCVLGQEKKNFEREIKALGESMAMQAALFEEQRNQALQAIERELDMPSNNVFLDEMPSTQPLENGDSLFF